MATRKSTRRASLGNRPTGSQVDAVRRAADDTRRLYHELPVGQDEQLLDAHVRIADWLSQFDNGVYADPPAFRENVIHAW